MAWQNAGQGQMGNMNEQNGVQAYTLQGVMRFLQTEWHSHERTRNAWEIEREEMKKRIAALEGEARSSKGLRGVLERQIRMLEFALRKERENVAKLRKGEPVDLSKDSKEYAREEIQKIKDAGKVIVPKTISHFDNEIDAENHLSQGIKQEKERERSKGFLTQCVEEITYHLLPGVKLPSDNLDLNNLSHIHSNGQQQPSQQELLEAYAQIQAQKQQARQQAIEQAEQQAHHHQQQQQQLQQQQQQQSFRNNVHANREPPVPSQPNVTVHGQSQPATRNNISTGAKDTVMSIVHDPNRTFQDQALSDASRRTNSAQDRSQPPEDQVESISHTYDSYGRQIASKDENTTPVNSQPMFNKDPDADGGWDFDEAPPPLQVPPDAQAVQRPDTEAFPSSLPSKSPTRMPGSHRRKSSGARRKSSDATEISNTAASLRQDASQFKVRFAMRGHLDVVRAVIFTGGGSPSDPEFCTAGDDGTIKRWHVPATYSTNLVGEDLDRTSHFTHRGHVGAVCSLAACPQPVTFANGGRVAGDGWIFSGGEDACVKVWERGRVDAKASLEGHTDAVWALCVLPGTTGSILGERCNQFGGPERVLLAAGAADGTILVWAVSAPPQVSNVSSGSNRGARGSRRANSISAGSNFPNSPQPSIATNTTFNYSLVLRIEPRDHGAPTSISPLSPAGTNFVVSYSDASVLVFDSRTGDELAGMASQETYDGTPNTAINAVIASSAGFDTREPGSTARRGSLGEDEIVHGATGGEGGVEGLVIAGYEDRYIRFFDANSGQCTYTMLAHPSAISSLSLSPDGRELVSGGHDASLRFWSLEKRNCTQEITSHRIMRGEGVCAVVWSPDGRFVISAGGDGAVKVFSRI